MPDQARSIGVRAVLPVLVAIPLAVIAAQPTAVERGLRFDSPGVLDLADRSLPIAGGRIVPVAELAAADAERVFAAPAIAEDPPALRFSDEEYGCGKPSRACSLEHERKRVAAAGSAVTRDGKRLTVNPSGGAPAVFVDWKQATTKTADGDEEAHWYLGRLPGSGYERVEVQFGHDAPGNFLINPQSGKVAFVHNGADLVAPSSDGRLLLTWNSLNPPLSLRVVALDGDGPRLMLKCEAAEGKERLTPVFKGWHDAHAFDFVVEIGEQGKSMARLASQLRRDAAGWHVEVGDIARAQGIGLTCREVTAH